MATLNHLGVVRMGNQKVFTNKIVLKEIHLQAPPSVMSSPKASVRGKWKCSTCKQSFRSHELLITHIEDFHNKQTTKYACTQCKMYLKDEFSFKVHKKQHQIDRKKGKK